MLFSFNPFWRSETLGSYVRGRPWEDVPTLRMIALGMDALAIAGQALLGRDLGAGATDRARAITWQMTRWGVGLGVVLMIVVLAGRTLVPALFGDDPLVQSMVAAALVVVALQQPLAGVVFVLDGVLLGAGDATYLAWAQVAALAAFVPAAWWVLEVDGSVTDIWWALTVFMLVRAGAFTARVRGGAWLVTGATR